MDNFYFLIRVISDEMIALYYFHHSKNLQKIEMPICFTSKNAISMYQLLSYHVNFSRKISLSHALYLGQEIYKAELARVVGQVYIQD